MTKTTEKSHRDPGLDLLRILAMLLIILHHSVDHSGVLECAPEAGVAGYCYIRFVYMLTQVCVNIYVLLSGYFLVRSHFKLQKLAALWMETVLYSLTIKLIFMLTGQTPFSAVSLASCVFPIVTGRYWFITIYLGLYMLSPFLNTAIRAMDRRQHLALNLVLMLLFSAWNSIHPSIAGMNSGGGWGLAWFVVLYLTAAWFRLYYEPGNKRGPWWLFWVGAALITMLLYCFAGRRLPIVKAVTGNWYRYDSLPAYLSSLALLVCFLSVEIKNARLCRWISFLAPSTLGVYLIHAHANLSPYLWEQLDLPRLVGRAYFPGIQLFVVLGIFLLCSGADILRRLTLGRLETSAFVKSSCDWAENRLKALFRV